MGPCTVLDLAFTTTWESLSDSLCYHKKFMLNDLHNIDDGVAGVPDVRACHQLSADYNRYEVLSVAYELIRPGTANMNIDWLYSVFPVVNDYKLGTVWRQSPAALPTRAICLETASSQRGAIKKFGTLTSAGDDDEGSFDLSELEGYDDGRVGVYTWGEALDSYAAPTEKVWLDLLVFPCKLSVPVVAVRYLTMRIKYRVMFYGV